MRLRPIDSFPGQPCVERERFLGLELTEGALAGARGRVSATGEFIGPTRSEAISRAA